MINIIQTTYDLVPDGDINDLPFDFLDSYYGVQKDGSVNLPPVPASRNFEDFKKYENEEVVIGDKVCTTSHYFFFHLVVF
jgi:hypothetical protein